MNRKKIADDIVSEYLSDKDRNGSRYLIARNDRETQEQRKLLYDALEPVFLGRKTAGTQDELDLYFEKEYGIDVKTDFVEGDEHYEEYLEASQAIAEGMSIYGGEIGFESSVLADLAERVWAEMEQKHQGKFKRINTMLEE